MEKYFAAIAFVLIGVTDGQFYNLPRSQTNSSVSFYIILDTGTICASSNETFEDNACSDPNRTEMVIDSIKEVHWFRNTTHKPGRSEIHGDCQSDTLDHSIIGITNNLTLDSGGSQEFFLDGSEETTEVNFIGLKWNLAAEGQAQGAEMKLNLFIFTKSETIIFEGQKAYVSNGTVKTTYEITNWQFCADTRFGNGSYEGGRNLQECQENRDEYQTTDDIDEVVLELKFTITKFSAAENVDAIINCFPENDDFAPSCKFGVHYAVSYSEMATIDETDACLPNEYPRINDCEAPEDSIIYTERLLTNNSYGNGDGSGSGIGNDDLACNKSAITYALPRFQISGFYDPADNVTKQSSCTSQKLAFLLFMLPLINMLLRIN